MTEPTVFELKQGLERRAFEELQDLVLHRDACPAGFEVAHTDRDDRLIITDGTRAFRIQLELVLIPETLERIR